MTPKDDEMEMPGRYRKRPIEIVAVQWKGDVANLPPEFALAIRAFQLGGDAAIDTLEGVVRAKIDDWIIKGIKGEFYPCKPDIFEATYDRANKPIEAREQFTPPLALLEGELQHPAPKGPGKLAVTRRAIEASSEGDASQQDPVLLEVLSFIELCRSLKIRTGKGEEVDGCLERDELGVKADLLYKKLDSIKWGTNRRADDGLLARVYAAMVEDFGDPDEKPHFTGSVAAGETMEITFELMREIKDALPKPPVQGKSDE